MESVKIKDNSQKKLAYEGLALRALEVNDPWLALHSQILSDSAHYKLYMLSEFEQTFEKSTNEIETAINSSILNDDNLGRKSIKSIVLAFRSELLKREDLSVSGFKSELSSLEHFAKIKLTKSQVDNSLGKLKYSSVEPYSFISGKQEQAANYYAETIEYMEKKETSRATVSLYSGDLAVFEAWLISQSMETKDHNYSIAAIRWALAVAALDMLESLPANPKSAAREIRKALLWAVGPENAKSLKKYFLTF